MQKDNTHDQNKSQANSEEIISLPEGELPDSELDEVSGGSYFFHSLVEMNKIIQEGTKEILESEKQWSDITRQY